MENFICYVTGLFNRDSELSRNAQNVRYTDLTPIADDVADENVSCSANGLEFVDYSEKAFAVVGETKAVKDILKKLGGRFNFRLTCGAGWIFPKTKLEEVKAALA